MKYRAKVDLPYQTRIIPIGTIFNQFNDWFQCEPLGGIRPYFSREIVESHSEIFEMIVDRLTSDQEDDLARRFIWVPKKDDRYFVLMQGGQAIERTWNCTVFDWYCFKTPYFFKTESESNYMADHYRKSFTAVEK
jgi:hypothetical protein